MPAQVNEVGTSPTKRATLVMQNVLVKRRADSEGCEQRTHFRVYRELSPSDCDVVDRHIAILALDDAIRRQNVDTVS